MTENVKVRGGSQPQVTARALSFNPGGDYPGVSRMSLRNKSFRGQGLGAGRP